MTNELEKLKVRKQELETLKKKKEGPFQAGDEFLLEESKAILIKDDAIGCYRFFLPNTNYLSTTKCYDISSISRIQNAYGIYNIECVKHTGVTLRTNEEINKEIVVIDEKIKHLTTKYKTGSIFSVEGDECIFAQVASGMFCLIDLKSGNRYLNPVELQVNFEENGRIAGYTYEQILSLTYNEQVVFVRGPKE